MTEKKTQKKAAAPEQEQSAGQVAWEWVKSGIIGFVIFLVVRTFLIQTFTIVSGSMEGTLLVGDFLVLNKSAYGATVPGIDVKLPGYDTITRNDIIVFRGHHEPIDLVKRLIGMPGDTLEMRDGVLHHNGLRQDEPYAHHTDPQGDGGHPWMDWQASYLTEEASSKPYYPTRDNWGPIVVPGDGYFVLGDNRDQSLDSRYWGFIRRPQIKGRAVALYFSYNNRPDGGIPMLRRVRWDRIGELLR
ncbi:MAG: signal peptidase I [Gemmatimonadota bacterium]